MRVLLSHVRYTNFFSKSQYKDLFSRRPSQGLLYLRELSFSLFKKMEHEEPFLVVVVLFFVVFLHDQMQAISLIRPKNTKLNPYFSWPRAL